MSAVRRKMRFRGNRYRHPNLTTIGIGWQPSQIEYQAYNDAGQKIKNDGIFTEVRYKLADWKERNSYDVFLNYRRVGSLSGVSSVEDYSKNVQGVQIGATYIPWKIGSSKVFIGRQTGYAY